MNRRDSDGVRAASCRAAVTPSRRNWATWVWGAAWRPLYVVAGLADQVERRFAWTAHNVVAHPLSELLFQAGMERAANAVHDATIPSHESGTGRG